MPYGYNESDIANQLGPGPATGESYIQRQQRLAKPPAPAQSTTNIVSPSGGSQPKDNYDSRPGAGSNFAPVAASSTPVQGDGKIPPPQPLAPVQQHIGGLSRIGGQPRDGFDQRSEVQATNVQAPGLQLAPAAVAQPPVPSAPRPEDTATMKWAPTQDGTGWVPADHPAAWKAPAGGATAGPGGAAAAPGSAYYTQGGRADAAQSGMFSQFAGPQHDQQNREQLDLVSRILQNPETMSPQVIEQMKQRSMEEALQMQRQAEQQQGDAIAGNGFSVNGGMADARRRATSENINNAILGQNRDIEIGAASQNRQDQIGALGAAESILGGQTGRAGNIYQNVLAGQQANRDDFYKGKSLDLQDRLGTAGIGLDSRRINNQASQFDASHGLDIMRFLESQRQGDNALGYNYASMNASNQNATMDRIMRAIQGGG